MAESIYQKELILSHWRNPRNFGRIESPNKKSFLSNPSCGDEVRIEAKIEKGKVKEIKFWGRGCIISMATASLLTEYAKGKTIAHLKKLNKDFIFQLIGIQLGPTRLKCALLPLEALQKLLE